MFKHSPKWTEEQLQERFGIQPCDIPELLKKEYLKAYSVNGHPIGCPFEHHEISHNADRAGEFSHRIKMLNRLRHEMGGNLSVFLTPSPNGRFGDFWPLYDYLEERGLFRSSAFSDPASIEITHNQIEQVKKEIEIELEVLKNRNALIYEDDNTYDRWKYLCIPESKIAFVNQYLSPALFEVIGPECLPEPVAEVQDQKPPKSLEDIDSIKEHRKLLEEQKAILEEQFRAMLEDQNRYLRFHPSWLQNRDSHIRVIKFKNDRYRLECEIKKCDKSIAVFDDKIRSMTPSIQGFEPEAESREQTHTRVETQQATGKSDCRTDQWKKARPIMEDLCKGNEKTITVEKIRSDPRFKACFKDGIPPGDSQTRRKLKEAGIKLAPGKRK